jgi:hypothetical protein
LFPELTLAAKETSSSWTANSAPTLRSGRANAKPGARHTNASEFAIIAQKASVPEPTALKTAQNLAQGCQQVWRDFEMMASFGTLYRIQFDDGTPVEYYRMVAPNSQLVLDQITDTPGAMLYRDADGWWWVPAGSNGYVLTINDLVPEWSAPTGGGGGASLPTIQGLLDPTSNTTTTTGVTQGCYFYLEPAQVITGVELWCRTTSATCRLTPCLYSFTGNLPDALVASGPQTIGVTAGVTRLPFTTPYTTSARGWYAIGCAIDNTGFSQPNNDVCIPSWNYPFPLHSPCPTIASGYTPSWLKCWPYKQ